MSSKLAVIYYSSTGHVHTLASAIAEGAVEAGAEVRVRRVAETVAFDQIQQNEQWAAHLRSVEETVPLATHEDLEWADAYAFGTPTRFGTPAAQLKAFIDSTGPLWANGVLASKPVTVFTSAQNPHGGQESTILSLTNVFYHWGSIIVPPGYTSDVVFASGGNPYGVSLTMNPDEAQLAAALVTARHQGARVAQIAARLLAAGELAPA